MLRFLYKRLVYFFIWYFKKLNKRKKTHLRSVHTKRKETKKKQIPMIEKRREKNKKQSKEEEQIFLKKQISPDPSLLLRLLLNTPFISLF